ncbi:MAG: hypothetical protein CM15mP46_4010 [Alphaproteobacteria bacterium]|nr:MAG: hypothetical protein CM15mP46_4010 [Alphaproteobacteria bacterium]
MPVHWYGKPYRPAFDMALTGLTNWLGVTLIAAAWRWLGQPCIRIFWAVVRRMQAVLITGAGLFLMVGGQIYCRYRIQPDWIVPGHR